MPVENTTLMSEKMQFTFDPHKAAQAAAYLLKLHGKPMDKRVLNALLYLADRESLIKTGAPITGDQMVCVPDEPDEQEGNE